MVLDMLLNEGKVFTQQHYIDKVNKTFPDYDIKRYIFSRPLQSYDKIAIKKVINGNCSFSIKINDCKTLSHVKTRIERRFAEHSGRTYRIKLNSISSSNHTLYVGNDSYKITKRGSGNNPSVRVNVKGKMVWLRVDALLYLLENK